MCSKEAKQSHIFQCIWLTGLLSAALVALTGCGESGPQLVPVRGKVTWQGQPVSVGHISFIPTTGAQPAIGVLSEDGAYQLTSHTGRMGIEPGQYHVVVQAYEGSFMENNVRYIVPENFSRVETSRLSATIPEDANGELEFNYDLP